MIRKPFHESIVDLIRRTDPADVHTFVVICKMVAKTEVPRQHRMVVEDALVLLAAHGGHQYMDEFLRAFRSLRAED